MKLYSCKLPWFQEPLIDIVLHTLTRHMQMQSCGSLFAKNEPPMINDKNCMICLSSELRGEWRKWKFLQMIAEREYRFWIIIFHNWSNHKSNFFLLLSEPPCKFLPEFAIISAWMHLFANFWGKTNLQDLILRSWISGRQWLNNRELHPIILKYQHLLLQTKWSVALRRGELTTGCCLGLREAIQQSQN